LLSLIVGLAVVPQQTPLELTEAPPSLVIVPPETALLRVISVTLAVVSDGGLLLYLHELKTSTETVIRTIRDINFPFF